MVAANLCAGHNPSLKCAFTCPIWGRGSHARQLKLTEKARGFRTTTTAGCDPPDCRQEAMPGRSRVCLLHRCLWLPVSPMGLQGTRVSMQLTDRCSTKLA